MTPPLDNAATDAGHKNTDGCWRAGAVISILLIAILLLGQLSLLGGVVSRCVFPWKNLVVRESTIRWRALFNPPIAVTFDFLQWGLLIALFALCARNVRFRYLLPLGLFLIGVVAVVTNIVASMFNVDIDVGFLSEVAPPR